MAITTEQLARYWDVQERKRALEREARQYAAELSALATEIKAEL